MERVVRHGSIVSSVPPPQVLVVGPLAYDDVSTPWASRTRVLGGSAAYASIAAAKHGPTMLVSVCGSDLRDDDLAGLRTAAVDVSGIEWRDGRTLRWSGTYSDDFSLSVVRNTDLGAVVGWRPAIPAAGRDAAHVFLTNTDPAIQAAALDQLHPAVVLLDTMDEWILGHRPALERIVARVTVVSINEHELQLISGEGDLARGAQTVLARGPRAVIVKRGARGASLFTPRGSFTVPAHPARTVDPTGAGDALGGAFVGRLARTGTTGDAGLRDALAAGVAAASLAVESFGVDALARAGLGELDARAAALERGVGTDRPSGLYEGR
jgi:sugar/nucleoside kinase (ribokinase family)